MKTFFLLLASVFLFSACNTEETPSAQKKDIAEITSLESLKNHNPDFDIVAVEKEGYWYSRYVLGQLMARAGMGEKMIPPVGAMPKMMAMSDADFDLEQFKAKNKTYGDGNHFSPPKNPHLIKTVYSGGDPHFLQEIDPSDFSTLRWDELKMDKDYTGEAFGWMILKEGEWAKNFHESNHHGTVQDPIGAQWRMVGLILANEAKAQFQTYINLKKTGKIRMNDTDTIVLLEGLSSLYGLVTNAKKHPLTQDAKIAPTLRIEIDALAKQVQKKSPQSINDASLKVQALVWYASETKGGVEMIQKSVDELLAFSPQTPTERAAFIRGLVEGQRILGTSFSKITQEFQKLQKDFDFKNGYFTSQKTYHIDDIGTILGALNALKIFPQKGIPQDVVEQMQVSFFESAVNQSGLMQSAPPVKLGKSPYEMENVADIMFRYPTIPVPPKAGGKYGIAPVFASEISFKNGAWKVTNTLWDTAGGMHTANEMIWFQYPDINGFPEL